MPLAAHSSNLRLERVLVHQVVVLEVEEAVARAVLVVVANPSRRVVHA